MLPHFVLFFAILLIPPVAWANSTQACSGCHQEEAQLWAQSHHAQSMQTVSASSVLGNFNQATAQHGDLKAKFSQQNGQFLVQISENGISTTYAIEHVFGVEPLQQYLVDVGNGHYQIMPFAWDTRSKSEGGQRWMHLYDEPIGVNDRLHWQQGLQNYNGMCADCHSDNLQANYTPKNNHFETTWREINVGCLACHNDKNQPHDATKKQEPSGSWQFKPGAKIASWQGHPRDNRDMESCYACHSLRSPLTNGFTSDDRFLDSFTPTFPVAPLYHSDGQIKEEVYVAGSFMQSKMFEAGVQCKDCHDMHSMKVKSDNNGLCLQCHLASEYETPLHHGHNDVAGSQCVNCHMPSTTYMQVDPRRDHSFTIPRPDLSAQFDQPNACVGCHQDKSNNWAAQSLEKLHGKPKAITTTEQDAHLVMLGYPLEPQRYYQLVNDNEISVYRRSAMLAMMPPINFPTHVLQAWLSHSDPFFRLAAVQYVGRLESLPSQLVAPLLNDEFRAVRVAAAFALVGQRLAPKHQDSYQAAYQELLLSNKVNNWRGEGRLNEALMFSKEGKIKQAEQAYLASIEIDPYFPASYINLAELYRSQNRSSDEGNILTKASQAMPQSAMIYYSLGLYYIRAKQLNSAVNALRLAQQHDGQNPQYAYMYVLAIDATGKTQLALHTLSMLQRRLPNSGQLATLKRQLQHKLKQKP